MFEAIDAVRKDRIIINGGNRLYGDVYIDGMKNAALPIVFATILTKSKCIIENLPTVSDVILSLEILKEMGASVRKITPTTVEIDTTNLRFEAAPYDLVGKMRASTYLLGAQLGRFGKAMVGWPGGCDFGVRPIDLHIKGFEALGATVIIESGYINANADNDLLGNTIYFDIASVGATVNVMLAAVCAEGVTVIENAAREPHIVDLANFFNTCGANISGAGTSVIKIRGVKELHGCTYTIIPDMIEAGTFMVAAAATGGCVRIRNVIPKHVESITAKLCEMGVLVEEGADESLLVTAQPECKNVNIKTLPYPGFPTDMHPQFAPLLCLASGVSCIQEGIWEHRFRYVDELRKMGATVMLDSRTATFVGSGKLNGAPVDATDLRAGAALVIAGLAADGITEISNVDYIYRGYDNIVEKLSKLGAKISEVTLPDPELIQKAN